MSIFYGSMAIGANAAHAHAHSMAQISDNIANSRTVGYRESEVRFQDLLTTRNNSPLIKSPETNSLFHGLTSYEQQFLDKQGSIQITSSNTDIAISGRGFFPVAEDLTNSSETFYSRDGNFVKDLVSVDGSDTQKLLHLVNHGGGYLMGQNLQNGDTDPTAVETVAIPIEANSPELPARATTSIEYEALLTLERPPGDVYQTQVQYWDGASGADATRQTMFVEWTRGTGENDWTVGFRETPTGPVLSTQAINFVAPTPGTDVVDSNQGNTPDVPSVPVTLSSGQQITFDFSKVASYFGLEIPPATVADGYPDGELLDVRFDSAGNLIGDYSNKVSQSLYRVSLAYFQNDNALEAVTGNNYRQTPGAGDRAFYQPLGGGSGTPELGFLHTQALENSNIALEEQFQDLITTQRAYQSASKIITVSDTMSQTAINTKR